MQGVWNLCAYDVKYSSVIAGLRCTCSTRLKWFEGNLSFQHSYNFYASAFRRRRHYVFELSVCLSVRPSEAWNTLFWPVHGSVGPPDQPWPFYGMSVRPERFPVICQRTHGGNGLKFYMLMYLDHLQNCLVYGHGLLIFLILALSWLCETGQIWRFRAFPGERMEEIAWKFAHWCILTTFRTD